MSRADASLFDLDGRVAIVTGGAGILGPHFVRGLAAAGADVAVLDLDATAATNVAAGIDAPESRSLGLACDVTDRSGVVDALARIEDELGHVSILINNAATKGSSLRAFFEPASSFDEGNWREVVDTNLTGLMNVASVVGEAMLRHGGGSIIQIASIYGVVGPDSRIYEGSEYLGGPINTPPVYAATKAGVIGLTRYLAAEWGSSGVRVNSISPGGVSSGQNERFERQYSARVPMGRMAQPEELVGPVLFLASDGSSYVTGHNLMVDGGLTAW